MVEPPPPLPAMTAPSPLKVPQSVVGEVARLRPPAVAAPATHATEAAAAGSDDDHHSRTSNRRLSMLAFVDAPAGQMIDEPRPIEDVGHRQAAEGSTVITNPEWLRRPSPDDMVRYYPPRAITLGREGRATVTCVVSGEGSLSDCRVDQEEPVGFGFGDAALKASRLFKVRPPSANGVPVSGATVSIPFTWLLPTAP